MKIKSRTLNKTLALGLGLSLAVLVPIGVRSAKASSQAWISTAADANWSNGANWSGGSAPGSTSTTTNDVATFNTALASGTIGGILNPIVIDSGRRIGSIVFDTANVGACQIGAVGGNTLILSAQSGATNGITINSAVANSQIIAGPISMTQPSSQSDPYGFTNNATNSNVTLTINGSISATNTSRGWQFILGGSNTGANTISAPITQTTTTASGFTPLTKTGAGTWILSGSNTFTGTPWTTAANGAQINGGVLSIQNTYALGTGIQATVNNGGTLEVANSIALPTGITLNFNSGGTIRGNGANSINSTIKVSTAAAVSATISTVNSSDVLTLGDGANDLQGGAADSVLHISGPGTVYQTQNSNYAGAWSIDAGTLKLGTATSLGASASVAFGGSTGALALNSISLTLPSLNASGSQVVKNDGASNATLTVNNSSANSFAGVIGDGSGTGTLALTKNGEGMLTLGGINTFSGATAVNAGGINVTGQLANSSSVSVASSGTLAGNGVIANSVTVASGAHLAPGNGGAGTVGTLTVGGLTLGAGSQLDVDIAGTSSCDQVSVTGNSGLTINGGQININGAAGVFSTNGVYNLIGYTGAIGGAGVGALTLNSVNQDTLSKSYTFASNGSYVTLTVASLGSSAVYWNADADGNWSSGPWTAATPNAVGAFAAFGGGGTEITANRTITVDGAYTVGTLTFNGAANGKTYTLASGTGAGITLDNSGTNSYVTDTAGSHTIDVPVALTGNGATFTVSGVNDTLSVSGVISGSGAALVKTGPGTLALTGSNNFTNGVTINSGSLAVNSVNSLGDIGSAVTINGGALRVTANLNSSRSINLGDAASAISVASGNTYTSNGVIADVSGTAGVLNKAGSGTLVLNGTNTYSGGTVINSGVVTVSNDANLGNTAGAVTINSGTLENTASLSTSRNFVLGSSSSTIQNDTGLTLSGTVSGSGALNKTGPGQMILNAANTYSGGSAVSSGTLTVGNVGGFGSIGSGTLALQNGGTFKNGFDANTTLGFGNTLNVSSGQSGTIVLGNRINWTGAVIGSGTLNVIASSNAARDDFSNSWTGFTGQTNLTGSGIVRMLNNGGNFNTGSFVNSSLDLEGTVYLQPVTNSGGNTYSFGALSGTSVTAGFTGGTAGGATISVGSLNTSTTFAGDLHSDNLTKVGTGTLTLTGTYNGGTAATTISAGTLQVGNGGTAGYLSGGTVTNNASLVFNRSDSVTVSNIINGSGSVSIIGSGTTFFAPAPGTGSGYTGVTTINNGSTLNINGQWALGGSAYGGLTFGANGGTLQYANPFPGTNGTGDITQTSTGTAKNVTLTGNATIDTNGNDMTYAYAFGNSGAGGLTKVGAGTLSLAGAANYLGATNLNGGVLQIVNGGSIPSSTVNVNTTNGLGFGTGVIAATIGGISGSSDLALTNSDSNGVALTVGGNNASTTYSGGLSGAGSLVKSGTGNLILTGSSSFTGSTTINAGTLQIGDGTTDGTIVGSSNIVINASLVYNRSTGSSYSYGGVISGTGSLTKSGAGTQALAGANTYSGATTINGGTLLLANTYALQNSSVTINNATDIAFGSGVTAFTLGGLTLSSSGTLSLLNADASPVALTVGGNNSTVTLNGSLSGTGASLVKAGTGTLSVVGASNYTGGSTVNGGTISFHGGSLSGTISMNNGTTLALSKLNSSSVGASNPVTVSGSVSFTSDLQSNGFGGAITGDSNAVITIVANQPFNFGSNSKQFQNFLGTVIDPVGANIDERFNGSWNNNGGDNTTFVVDGGIGGKTGNSGTWNLGALTSTGTTGNLGGGSTVSYTVGAKNLDTVYAGIISANNFTKVGTGNLTLTGNNTYVGVTNVSGGTLTVNGTNSGAGTVTVSDGATLAGSGVIAGAVVVSGTLDGSLTLNGNATINAGAQAAAAAFNGNVTANGSITSAVSIQSGMNLSGTGSVAGVTVNNGAMLNASTANLTTGDLKILGGGTFALTLDTSLLTSGKVTASNITLDAAGGAVLALNDNGFPGMGQSGNLHFLDYTGTLSGQFCYSGVVNNNSVSNALLSEGDVITLNGVDYQFSYSSLDSQAGSNSVALLAVPEPSTWAMMVGGLGALGFFQKARRRSLK